MALQFYVLQDAGDKTYISKDGGWTPELLQAMSFPTPGQADAINVKRGLHYRVVEVDVLTRVIQASTQEFVTHR